MAPHRNYDYGLRGARDTTPPRFRGDYRMRGYDAPYLREPGRPPRPNRVTARYNRDYVYGNEGERFPRNYNFYTGDRMDRMGDERWYRRPYMTTGGSWTLRGSAYPTGYDYPDYGPNYGGRYPDEL
jgi:hypothetical protein